MRSRFLLKLDTSRRYDKQPNKHPMASPYHMTSPHDSNSSFDAPSTCSSSSPMTSTFSSIRSQNHSRWPSSSSSLASTVESSANAPKSTTLHDLVEEPAEREDSSLHSTRLSYDVADDDRFIDDSFCMCDTPLCDHRQVFATPPSGLPQSPAASNIGEDHIPSLYRSSFAGRSFRRRDSDEVQADTITTRLSRRLPSFSRRRTTSKSSLPPSPSGACSNPPSRTPSLRLSSIRTSFQSTNTVRKVSAPLPPPLLVNNSEEVLTTLHHVTDAEATIPSTDDNAHPADQGDEPERPETARTPLLPPMISSHISRYDNIQLQSPLQSPAIASPSDPASMFGTPTFSPMHSSMLTPPLSTKASDASMHKWSSSGHFFNPSSDTPPLAISDEDDPWAYKLGHANFTISPAPYMPLVCNPKSCIKLRDDWEAARIQYLRQAGHIAEHYGPTSQTFHLAGEKWAEIEAQWRLYYEKAYTHAHIMAQSPEFQPLTETVPLTGNMLYLHDAEKFPVIDHDDIVGPMVQVKPIVQHEQGRGSLASRRPAFLKLFTDPASLLGVRSHFGRTK